MDISASDQDFLRDLVKFARQRPNPVNWVDRDGTARVSPLLPAEMEHLNRLARALRLSKSAVLQQAAFLPAKPKPKAMADSANPPEPESE